MNVAELITLLAPLDPSLQVHVEGAYHVDCIRKRGLWKPAHPRWYAPEPERVRLLGHWPKPKPLASRVELIEKEMVLSALAGRLTVVRGWR